ncbi:MAG: universal stress protein [Gammaproteobacteria bacterium]|jgi:universal stress protein E|nr:universal stress protein [Gammaproteobacteria bacterium]
MKRFSNILFTVTSDEDVSVSFGKAVSLAKNNQAKLTVAGVIDASDEAKELASSSKSPLLDAMVESKQNQLDALIKDILLDDIQVETKILIGLGFIEIIREALNFERDLVIKSLESSESIGDKLLGSVDMKLLRKCPCPVWLIRSSQQHGFREILVGLDYQPDNDTADELNMQLLQMASSLALAEFGELHIVHAWEFAYELFYRSSRSGNSTEEVDKMIAEEEDIRRQWLADLVDKHCSIVGEGAGDYLKPQIHLIKGNPRVVVPECAREIGAELVVVGTVCRTGIPGLIIGNTVEEILNRIDSSVLAVKPKGFVSPVT